jgi:hypothetical protein
MTERSTALPLFIVRPERQSCCSSQKLTNAMARLEASSSMLYNVRYRLSYNCPMLMDVHEYGVRALDSSVVVKYHVLYVLAVSCSRVRSVIDQSIEVSVGFTDLLRWSFPYTF